MQRKISMISRKKVRVHWLQQRRNRQALKIRTMVKLRLISMRFLRT